MPILNRAAQRHNALASSRKGFKNHAAQVSMPAIVEGRESLGWSSQGATLQQLREEDKRKVANLIQQVVQLGSRVKELENVEKRFATGHAAGEDTGRLRLQLDCALQLLRRFQLASCRTATRTELAQTPLDAEVEAFATVCMALGVSDTGPKASSSSPRPRTATDQDAPDIAQRPQSHVKTESSFVDSAETSGRVLGEQSTQPDSPTIALPPSSDACQSPPASPQSRASTAQPRPKRTRRSKSPLPNHPLTPRSSQSRQASPAATPRKSSPQPQLGSITAAAFPRKATPPPDVKPRANGLASARIHMPQPMRTSLQPQAPPHGASANPASLPQPTAPPSPRPAPTAQPVAAPALPPHADAQASSPSLPESSGQCPLTVPRHQPPQPPPVARHGGADVAFQAGPEHAPGSTLAPQQAFGAPVPGTHDSAHSVPEAASTHPYPAHAAHDQPAAICQGHAPSASVQGSTGNATRAQSALPAGHFAQRQHYGNGQRDDLAARGVALGAPAAGTDVICASGDGPGHSHTVSSCAGPNSTLAAHGTLASPGCEAAGAQATAVEATTAVNRAGAVVAGGATAAGSVAAAAAGCGADDGAKHAAATAAAVEHATLRGAARTVPGAVDSQSAAAAGRCAEPAAASGAGADAAPEPQDAERGGSVSVRLSPSDRGGSCRSPVPDASFGGEGDDVHVHIHFSHPDQATAAAAYAAAACSGRGASGTAYMHSAQPPFAPEEFSGAAAAAAVAGFAPWPSAPDPGSMDEYGQEQSGALPPPMQLPLQPLTRLVAFDDSLADLVSEVDSLMHSQTGRGGTGRAALRELSGWGQQSWGASRSGGWEGGDGQDCLGMQRLNEWVSGQTGACMAANVARAAAPHHACAGGIQGGAVQEDVDDDPALSVSRRDYAEREPAQAAEGAAKPMRRHDGCGGGGMNTPAARQHGAEPPVATRDARHGRSTRDGHGNQPCDAWNAACAEPPAVPRWQHGGHAGGCMRQHMGSWGAGAVRGSAGSSGMHEEAGRRHVGEGARGRPAAANVDAQDAAVLMMLNDFFGE
eukprot:jgi/Ulvmu1/6446/UM003_0076.1